MTDDIGAAAIRHILARFLLKKWGLEHCAGTGRAKATGNENADGLRSVLQ
jgi:hypothetical protein